MRDRARGIRLALRHRDFRLLWLGQLVGDLGDILGRIALAVLVFDETSSTFLTAAVFAVVVLPFLGPGQTLTAWAERFPRRTVLIVSSLVSAAGYLTIALPLPVAARFLVLFVVSCSDAPFLAVRRALVPETVPSSRYSDAVALTAITYEVCILAGAAVAGVLVAAIGPTGVLLIDAGTFLVSAGLLAAMGAGRQAPVEQRSIAEQLAEGLAAIRGDARVRRLAWFFPLASAGALGGEALITPLVKEELQRGEAVIGILAALISAGVLLTTALLRTHTRHDALLRQSTRVALLGAAVAAAAFALPAELLTAMVAFVGLGVVFAFRVPITVVFGQRLPDDVRSSAFSVLDSGYAAAQLVGSLGAGALATLTEPSLACSVFAVLSLLAAVLAMAMPLKADRSAAAAAVS